MNDAFRLGVRKCRDYREFIMKREAASNYRRAYIDLDGIVYEPVIARESA